MSPDLQIVNDDPFDEIEYLKKQIYACEKQLHRETRKAKIRKTETKQKLKEQNGEIE